MNTVLRLGICIALVSAIVLALSMVWAPTYVDKGSMAGSALRLPGLGYVMVAPIPRIEASVLGSIPARVVVTAWLNEPGCSLYLGSVASLNKLSALSVLSSPSNATRLIKSIIGGSLCRGRGSLRCSVPLTVLTQRHVLIVALCPRGPSMSISYRVAIETPIAPCTNPIPPAAALGAGLALACLGIYREVRRLSRLR